MFAVIEIGGKQYNVREGMLLNVEKLGGKSGDTVTIDRVLLTSDGETSHIGQPYVSNAVVQATIVREFRDKKTTVLKYKSKVRYRKKFGHRQTLTQLKVTSISAS
ncbi:MAG: 50S ribosomal protein L21 [Candidatus Kerfeldbacteria bacterium]